MAEIDHQPRARRTVQVHRQFPTLRTLGMATEQFLGYVNLTIRAHAVDVVLLTCILRGRGRHVIGEQSIEVGPGSVGITHYGQEHDLLTEAGGMDVMNLYLDLEHHPLPLLPRQLQGDLAAMLVPHRRLVHRINRQVQLQLDDAAQIAQPLGRMLREQTEHDVGYESVMRQQLSLFLIDCCRSARRAEVRDSDVPSGGPAWLPRVLQMIEQRYDEPLGLSDLSAEAQVSREHLCRQFARAAGCSPIAYLNRRRIQAAMWLLRTTDERVIEVALRCGYNDLSHFNRLFKTMVGTTPRAYRRGSGLDGDA
ncbi:MAG: helix-turn-helix transcriptional regulator [Phycisphaeraceae bacterium]|nr:helix-turn-helix transcriptional regulator [Phycisphaeraceae bacterium]